MITTVWGNVHAVTHNEIRTPEQVEQVEQMESSYPSSIRSSLEENYCLYLEVNKKHPLFELTETDTYYDFDMGFEWHGGPTYSKWSYDKDGNVTHKTVGCDYQHLGDDYIHINTVLRDMDTLLAYADSVYDNREVKELV